MCIFDALSISCLVRTLVVQTLHSYIPQLSFNTCIISFQGPYTPHWEVFKTCKGPKQGDCGLFQILDASNMSNVHFHLEIDKECPVTAVNNTLLKNEH